MHFLVSRPRIYPPHSTILRIRDSRASSTKARPPTCICAVMPPRRFCPPILATRHVELLFGRTHWNTRRACRKLGRLISIGNNPDLSIHRGSPRWFVKSTAIGGLSKKVLLFMFHPPHHLCKLCLPGVLLCNVDLRLTQWFIKSGIKVHLPHRHTFRSCYHMNRHLLLICNTVSSSQTRILAMIGSFSFVIWLHGTRG